MRQGTRLEARKKVPERTAAEKLEDKTNKQNGDGNDSVGDDDEDALKVDEAKVDESKQMDFAKVEKRFRTTGGGSTELLGVCTVHLSIAFLCKMM